MTAADTLALVFSPGIGRAGMRRGLVVVGRYAYMADGQGGLLILRFDLAQPYRFYLPLIMRSGS